MAACSVRWSSILHRAAIAGRDIGPAGVASDEQVAALQAGTGGFLAGDLPSEVAILGVLQGVEPGAVIPLVAGADLVGIIACGQRPQRPLASSDLELLGVRPGGRARAA